METLKTNTQGLVIKPSSNLCGAVKLTNTAEIFTAIR